MADRIVQATEAFSATVDGIPYIVNPGHLYYATDRIVKGREHLFRDVTVLSTGKGGERVENLTSVSGSAVETATAEPGKRRYTRRATQDDGLKTTEPVDSEV